MQMCDGNDNSSLEIETLSGDHKENKSFRTESELTKIMDEHGKRDSSQTERETIEMSNRHDNDDSDNSEQKTISRDISGSEHNQNTESEKNFTSSAGTVLLPDKLPETRLDELSNYTDIEVPFCGFVPVTPPLPNLPIDRVNHDVPEPPPLPPVPFIKTKPETSQIAEPLALPAINDDGRNDVDHLIDLIEVTIEARRRHDPHFVFDDLLERNLLMDFDSDPPEREILPFPVGVKQTALCQICYDYVDLYHRFCCSVPVCQDCLSSYFTTQVTQGIVRIQCPCCKSYVHRDEIGYHLKEEIKLKFFKFLVDANKEAHIKTCPRCSLITRLNPQDVTDPRIKRKGLQMICEECSLLWCFPCEAPWHEGITCKQFRKGDKLLKTWAKENHYGQQNAQRCPKCKVFIQRITGCDHMKCRQCNSEFCYRCGDPFRSFKFLGDHYQRFSVFGCKYNFKSDKPTQRKLIRGAVLGGKIAVAPVVAGLAVVCGVAAIGIGVIALPIWGSWKIHGYRMKKKSQKRSQRIDREYRHIDREWRQSRSRDTDPYLDMWMRQRSVHQPTGSIHWQPSHHDEFDIEMSNEDDSEWDTSDVEEDNPKVHYKEVMVQVTSEAIASDLNSNSNMTGSLVKEIREDIENHQLHVSTQTESTPL